MTELPRLSIAIIGASGDLARKKVIPALFALYSQGYLPEKFHVFGFARTAMTDDEFRARIKDHLTCRYAPPGRCDEQMAEFLKRCHYVAGHYDSVDSYLELFQRMRQAEGEPHANHIFYMSVPPFLFTEVGRAMGNAGLVRCGNEGAWSRVVIEKPFGSDRASSDELVERMGQVFEEEQTYRIDHYLGKEVIQNLLVLRFANLVFEPIWNSEFVESVRISWKEDFGVGDRGGYFDQYGIIRDVIQNHLAQILALTAMEPPASFRAWDVSAAKAAALRAVVPAGDDWVVGQYEGYRSEPGIPAASATPTFAAGELRVDNARWRGTPFLLEAGKGLNERVTEIHVRFRSTQCCGAIEAIAGRLPPNELAIRVQPDEQIRLGIVNKVPGLEMKVAQSWLNLAYKAAFQETPIPEAYESLLLDVIQGDRSLFITREELAAAWDVFTPLLHDLEARAVQPVVYAFGSPGPRSVTMERS